MMKNNKRKYHRVNVRMTPNEFAELNTALGYMDESNRLSISALVRNLVGAWARGIIMVHKGLEGREPRE